MSEQPTGSSETTPQQEVEAKLRLHDATSMHGSLGKLLKGLGVCLVIGFVFATFMKVNTDSFGWWLSLLLYLIIVAGLSIWYELRTRKDYLAPHQEIDLNKPNQGQSNPLIGKLGSIVFWGPLAVIAGIRGMRGQHTPLQHAAFVRSSFIVVDLMKLDGGIEIKELLYPPEDMRIFGAAIDLLTTHGWIGKSKEGNTVWLDSYNRKKLAEKRLTQGSRSTRH